MPSRDLADADQRLVSAWRAVLKDYYAAYPNHSLILTCTYRPVEEQAALYAQGRTAPGSIVTQLDGVTHKSNHNVYPARALDFCVVIYGKPSWDLAQYEPVAVIAEAHGLVAGAHWHSFRDPPHLELPGGNPT
jgi:peptidoglycan L-alanyl-D-glutamate endopeptidase CwlK